MSKSIDLSLTQLLIKQIKSDSRWRNFRFFMWVTILLLYGYFGFGHFFHRKSVSNAPYVALLRLHGPIMPETPFSAYAVMPHLQAAFADKHAKGVILVINSPGGSPVQSSIIHDKILYLKKRYHKKTIVIGEDSLASGAYLVATAADKIFVNPDTVTGSIGVIMKGFGFAQVMQKIGITRRVFTAGTNKDRLDAFESINPIDIKKIHKVLTQVHLHFIDDVKRGRGARLHGSDQVLFSGDFWSGDRAVKLGLVDGTSNLWNVMHKEFNVSHFKNFSAHPDFLQSIIKKATTQVSLHLYNSTPLREQAY